MTSHHLWRVAQRRFVCAWKSEASGRQRRIRKCRGLNRYKDLKSRDLLGVGFSVDRIGIRCEIVLVDIVPAEMRMNARRVVMVAMVAVEVRVQERGAQTTHLEGDAQTRRDEPPNHNCILPASHRRVKVTPGCNMSGTRAPHPGDIRTAERR